jgi:broad specificity phosphatase PhoE
MLTLYYSPHMTSVDNEAGRASGHADVPLSDSGRLLAVELGQHYAAIRVDAVYCSDLRRATETAAIAFGPRGPPIIADPRLREIDFGALTQHPPSEVRDDEHITVPYPGGESLTMAVRRVGACLRDAMRAYDGKSIVMIGHRATKYGIVYFCGEQSISAIVATPWEWLDVPIWRYELHADRLAQRDLALLRAAQAPGSGAQ